MENDFSPEDYSFNEELGRTYLGLLTPTEKRVLSLRCEGKKYKDIAAVLVVSQKAVEFHLSNIYGKLKLDDTRLGKNERKFLLFNFFCSLLGEMLMSETPIPPEEPKKPSEIIPYRMALPMVIDDEDNGDGENGGGNGRIILVTRRERWPYILIILLLVSVGYLLWLLWNRGDSTIAVVQATSTISATSPQPTTPLPSPTLLPTSTSEPTQTLIPTPPPLFFDNFERNISGEWEVVYGTPTIVNGTLTTNENTLMLIEGVGTSYTVSAKISRYQGGEACKNGRVKNYLLFNDSVAFAWGRCDIAWYVLENNTLTLVPNSEKRLPEGNKFTVEVLVDNGFFEARIDEVFSSFSDPRFTEGKIGLKLSPNMVIDNFKVYSAQ